MSEHPIPFNDEMVRAILQDRKTQTRRPVKLRAFERSIMDRYDWDYRRRDGVWESVTTKQLIEAKSPFGMPGDTLWVRECWQVYSRSWEQEPTGSAVRIRYRADGSISDWLPCPLEFSTRFIKGVDHNTTLHRWKGDRLILERGERWRPSVHMPRWASRITLRVKRVWVERLRDISFDDAIAEGAFQGFQPEDGHGFRSEARNLFRDQWDAIYTKRDLGWKKDPWVWACEFEVVEK